MLKMLQRKYFSFISKPRFVQLWFLPVCVLLAVSRVAILTVSFNQLAHHLGAKADSSALLPLLNPMEEARAAQISQAVCLAASYTPWNSNCFTQAVTARLMLGFYSIPYALYFGMMRDPISKEFKAHAWVVAGRVHVTGGSCFEQFTIVGCFVSPQLLVRT